MTNAAPSLLVAAADHAAIVKVSGRANFSTSVNFKRLIAELRQRGVADFVLDLSDCITMDSTFLGVLAGTALQVPDGQDTSPPNGTRMKDQPDGEKLRLLNPNQRVLDLLDNLGVSELFHTLQCNPPSVETQYVTASNDIQPSREELSLTCLQAHRLLMNLNPDNVPKFKEVAQFLAEDVKKAGEEAKSDPASSSGIASERQ